MTGDWPALLADRQPAAGDVATFGWDPVLHRLLTSIRADDDEDDDEQGDDMDQPLEGDRNPNRPNNDGEGDRNPQLPNVYGHFNLEIMEKLVGEGSICKVGTNKFAVNKPKELEYEFNVKDQLDDQPSLNRHKTVPGLGEDYIYVQALYHALPMKYVTIAKLQTKLEGKVNESTVRKLIEKMARDGFLEATSNCKLGKRVIHSKVTEKKLNEVRKALDFDAMDKDVHAPQNKLNQPETGKSGNKKGDVSTCGVLHSVGSDIPRMRVRSESELQQSGSVRSGQHADRTREEPNTSTSKAGPVYSRESTVPGYGKSKLNGHIKITNGVDDVICSKPSQDKRARKGEHGNKKADVSTCGVLHPVGSDITHMRVRSESELQQNGSVRSGQHADRTREDPNTSTSRAGPVYSRESTVPGYGKSKLNGHIKNTYGVDDVICSKPSQDKFARKGEHGVH